MDISSRILDPVSLHGFARALFLQFPPTWLSSIASNTVITLLGLPLLKAGLSLPGIASSFLLGTLTWKAFGPRAFVLVFFFFVTGTAVTKIKIKHKEKDGIAEKRKGKRGPTSVWCSSAAASFCAVAALFGLGGSRFYNLWNLGFVANFATKLSDTVSSEIGKAYGTITYSVATLKPVPRGTEGAMSVEGTLAGFTASILFCILACAVDQQITTYDAVICFISSQIANLLESYIGATIQDRKGFKWLNNDAVNVINVSVGATIAIAVSYMTTATS